MRRLLWNNLSKWCYMIMCGGWGWQEERKAQKTLADLNSPVWALGRPIQSLHSELVPCSSEQQGQGWQHKNQKSGHWAASPCHTCHFVLWKTLPQPHFAIKWLFHTHLHYRVCLSLHDWYSDGFWIYFRARLVLGYYRFEDKNCCAYFH